MSQRDIFVALGKDGYEYCHPVRNSDFEVIGTTINGEFRGDSWSPIPVELIRRDNNRSLEKSDSPWLGDHALIVRSEAALAMGNVLRGSGELLPLVCPDARLLVFNPLRALPALDESTSSIIRFDSGQVMMVKKYVFIHDLIDGVDAFKLTNLRVSPTFFSRRVVDAWRDRGLVGLTFKKVA